MCATPVLPELGVPPNHLGASPMVSWRQPTLETTSGWIDRRVRDEERHGLSMWAVERRGEHEVIGLAGFLPRDDGRIELGYVVHARHWGGGYGTEAAGAALGALGDDPRVRLVIATIRPFNSRSLSVARAVGLRQIESYVDDRGQMLIFGVGA